MKTVAIVQARMGSSRLPGKVLMDLGGRTVLDRVVDRLGSARSLDQVVVAIPQGAPDDVLASRCEARGWSLFRGSEHDLLDRYYRAAAQFGADVVVRVTSDCPLIDPGLVDEVVGALVDRRVDYAANILEPRTFPRGLDVEAFTFSALERAWHEDDDPSRREHVTPFIRLHPRRFSATAVHNPVDRSHLRWTVDTAEDLALVRVLLERVGSPSAGWEEFLALVERHPELLDINRHVVQKTLDPR